VPLSLDACYAGCIGSPEKWSHNAGTDGGGVVLHWLTIGLPMRFRGTWNPFDAEPLQSVSVGF